MTITVSGNIAANLRQSTIANVQRVGTTNDVTVTYNDTSTLSFPGAWGQFTGSADCYASTDGVNSLHNTAVSGLILGHTAIAVIKANVQNFAFDPSTKTATYTFAGGSSVQISTTGYPYEVFPQ